VADGGAYNPSTAPPALSLLQSALQEVRISSECPPARRFIPAILIPALS
jgi:hypothetical protein